MGMGMRMGKGKRLEMVVGSGVGKVEKHGSLSVAAFLSVYLPVRPPVDLPVSTARAASAACCRPTKYFFTDY